MEAGATTTVGLAFCALRSLAYNGITRLASTMPPPMMAPDNRAMMIARPVVELIWVKPRLMTIGCELRAPMMSPTTRTASRTSRRTTFMQQLQFREIQE
ncbi:hypothetical protein D3C71_1605930 [compost metagenome]